MRCAARRSRRTRSWAAVSLAALLVGGCGDGPSPAARTSGPPGKPISGARVAVVVLENHGPEVLRGGWLGPAARRGGIATHAYGETHPSLGNYLAMISGSTQGVSDDDVGHGPYPAPTLVGQLTKAGIPW